MITKKIDIDGKKYTLTVRRSLIRTIYQISPELLRLKDAKKAEEIEESEIGFKANLDLIANIDVLFYEMIKVAHSNISQEKASEIYDKFDSEYDDAATSLIELAMSIFTSGDQEKKKIVWED